MTMTRRSERRKKLLDDLEAALDRVEAELEKGKCAEVLPGEPLPANARELPEEGYGDEG